MAWSYYVRYCRKLWWTWKFYWQRKWYCNTFLQSALLACDFGKFSVGNDQQTLSTVATRAFQQGYDIRFAATMSIPIIVTDLLIRLVWSFKQVFYYKRALKEAIPTSTHGDLRLMLLTGNAVLCFVDGVDAGVRSGGNMMLFLTRLNLIAWGKLIVLVYKEVCIRMKLPTLLIQIDMYKKMNILIENCLAELEKIDFRKYEEETQSYSSFIDSIDKITDEKELNLLLKKEMPAKGIKLPWGGDFDRFMNENNSSLVFE